jgi:hypothetical protein
MDVSATAQTATITVPNIAGAISYLYSPIVAMIFGSVLVSFKSIYNEVKTVVSAGIAFLASKQGQAEVKDVTALATDLQAAMADAGHPAPANVTAVLNGLLSQIPNVAQIKTSLILALIGASLLFASTAKAGIDFGPISISPTASGTATLIIEPALSATFGTISGGVWTPSPDKAGGLDILYGFGAYQIGLEGAFDYDSNSQIFYLTGGITAGIAPYGTLAVLWRENACLLGYSLPIGVGAQVTQ